MTEKHPQSYQQIAEVLDMLERMHTQVGKVCRSGRAAIGDTRNGLAAETFAERQEAMAAMVAESRKDLSEELSTTFVQYVPTDSVDRLLETLEAETTDPERLSVTVVRLQNEIAELVDAIRRESPSVELEEFLDAVVTREFAEARATTETIDDMDQA